MYTPPLHCDTPITHFLEAPKSGPANGLHDEFKKADELLITMHDRNELGTMDMDLYSQQLLNIKKDYCEAIKGKTEVSDRRARAIKAQISTLIAELHKRRF